MSQARRYTTRYLLLTDEEWETFLDRCHAAGLLPAAVITKLILGFIHNRVSLGGLDFDRQPTGEHYGNSHQNR